MEFLDKIPPTVRLTVRNVITNISMNIDQKVTELRNCIGDQFVLAEAVKYAKQENILANVAADNREVVIDLLNSTDLDFNDKMNFLKDLIPDPQAFVNAGNFLKEYGTQMPPTTDFIGLASSQKQRLMKLALDRNEINTLEKLVANEKEEVQEAFKNWRISGQQGPSSSGASPTMNYQAPQPPHQNFANRSQFNYPPSSIVPGSYQQGFQNQQQQFYPNMSTTPTPPPRTHRAGAPSSNLQPDFYDKLQKITTVLILGETGVGKSTFINGFVNYLKYGTIDEALQGGVEILIKACFTLPDEHYNQRKILCEPTIRVEREGCKDNEVTDPGQSSTQHPKSYIFSWGPPGNRKSVRIIDTPGICDVRGVQQDKENFQYILNFIADFKEINAICILLKPNEAKLTLTFRFCINELLAHLHVSASKNILFCFTNARQTNYLPGETLRTLQAHLDNLYKEKGIQIELNEKTMFCFDNEAFRFLCALRQGLTFAPGESNAFNSSWMKTVESTFKLFNRISELTPHDVENTLCVNNIRAVITTLTRPLAEIARNQMVNIKLINDKMREIDEYIKNGKDLEDRLYVEQVKIVPQEMEEPTTVCTSQGCVEYMRFSDEPNSPMETVYKTKCHSPCSLLRIQTELCPNPALKDCTIFDKDMNSCIKCRCPWTSHMHIKYELKKIMEKTIDPTVENSIKTKQGEIETARLFIENMKQKKANLHKDAKQITESCRTFAAFLKKHSLLPVNDSYIEYVDHLIQEEKDKTNQGGSDDILKQLEAYKAEYKSFQAGILGTDDDGSGCNKTIEEIYEMVEDLKKMDSGGKILVEIQKLEMLSVRKQPQDRGTTVDLSSGYINRVGLVGQAANFVSNYFRR